MANGYEQTYKVIVPRLQDCNFIGAAKNLGFTLLSEDALSIDFLGRTYTVTKAGVRPVDEKEVQVNILSVLVYYAISKGKGEPWYDFCLLHQFSQGLFTSKGPGTNWQTAPLRKEFGASYQHFADTAAELGLIYEGSRVPGTHTWQYRLLPKIPVKVIYYEGDDEFPCDIHILYDKTAISFLDFEPLAVLNGCFINHLAAFGKRQVGGT
ncbi:MAG: DUF3786 domain-containing protein [Treponema sp.]|jgi:hypothetical protein|nr:DUF3786 domain-containing protein [Treponema sp.]